MRSISCFLLLCLTSVSFADQMDFKVNCYGGPLGDLPRGELVFKKVNLSDSEIGVLEIKEKYESQDYSGYSVAVGIPRSFNGERVLIVSYDHGLTSPKVSAVGNRHIAQITVGDTNTLCTLKD